MADSSITADLSVSGAQAMPVCFTAHTALNKQNLQKKSRSTASSMTPRAFKV